MRRGAWRLLAVGVALSLVPSPVVADTVAPEATLEAVCATVPDVPANAEAAAIIVCGGDDVDVGACADALADVYEQCKGPVEDYVRCIKESGGGWNKYWDCLGLQ